MKKITVFFSILILLLSPCFAVQREKANADELSDNISDQLEKIDLSKLDEYFGTLGIDEKVGNLSEIVEGLLKGEYSVDYKSVFNFLLSSIFEQVKDYLPFIVGVLAIALLCGILDKLKPSFSSDEISNVIFFVSFIGIVLLLSRQIISFYQIAKNTIENIANLSEIMSPIIITLMIAAGGEVSASIYSPTVAFLSSGIISIISKFILPLVGLMTVFSLLSNVTTTVKLNKFAELCAGTIKWTLGIIFTVFTFFLSVQGIASGTYDGISIKAAKYTISNSVPIVGGFLSGGLDLVVAGCVLIKNAVGVAVVFALFYTIFSRIISMLVFSWMLKFLSAIVESISDIRISNICVATQKCVTYLVSVILVVSLMFFITVMLMIISANAFL